MAEIWDDYTGSWVDDGTDSYDQGSYGFDYNLPADQDYNDYLIGQDTLYTDPNSQYYQGGYSGYDPINDMGPPSDMEQPIDLGNGTWSFQGQN